MKKNIINLLLTVLILILSTRTVMAVTCGTEVYGPNIPCDCPAVNNTLTPISPNGARYCCGELNSSYICIDPSLKLTVPDNEDEVDETKEEFKIDIPEVSAGTLNFLNPLKQYSSKADDLSTPGGILTEVLNFAFPIAGIILFLMILFGGLKMLTGATNESKLKEGQQMIVSAIVGFIILFAAYWIATLLEMIFGISILS